jgi:PAS domain S-box-containing protein
MSDPSAETVKAGPNVYRQSFPTPEALLSAIVDSTDDAIVSKDLNGIVTSWNPGAARIFGYTTEEMVGKSITILFPPDRLDEEPAILAKLRSGQRVDHFDTKRVRKDGQVVDVSLTISPVRNAAGEIVGASKIARDVTERKKAEEALLLHRTKLEILNELGMALTGQLDLSKMVQAVTDAGRALSGAAFGAFFYNVVNDQGEAYTLYTLSGAPREAFEKFGMPRNTEIFAPTFSGKGVVRLDDVLADPRYGKMPPHHGMPKGHLPVRSYLAVPVISNTGTVIGGLFFGHPVPGQFSKESEDLLVAIAAQAAVAIDNARLYSELREELVRQKKLEAEVRVAAEEAAHQSRMKDEFLATLSHELRTPLQSILGWIQILKGGDLAEGELEQGLDVIARNAQSQTGIIEDLLDMSRILSGKVRLDVQRAPLAPLIEAALEIVKPAADAKGIRLQAIIDPLAKPVAGDPNRLQQIFWNLLSNAIKFTPRGGRVQVLLERVNSHLEVNVVDSGAGISPEFLPFVFDRFRQADSSTTRKHGGLGLGLAIVKHLVELHGGTVRAKSGGESQGSTFTVTLPLAALHAEPDETRRHPAGPSASTPRAPSLLNVSVVVVDDEEDARVLIAKMLTKAGAKVRTGSCAAEAIDAVRSEPPDVLVSDIGMPDEDGFSLIRAIRKLPGEQGGAVPAIALTAYTRTEDRIRVIAEGFQMHLAKPADAVELVTMVASLAKKTPG